MLHILEKTQLNGLSLYSIVNVDSSADLRVNFKIVQNRPTIQAVCTKLKKNLCIFGNILIIVETTQVEFGFSIIAKAAVSTVSSSMMTAAHLGRLSTYS